MTHDAPALHTVYLSLGTNLGDKRHNLDRALEAIGELVGRIVSRSSYVETEPWGFDSDNTFLNACACVCTPLSPQALLEATQEIERTLGRTSKTAGHVYHDRIIDIDILLYDQEQVRLPGLEIPHPHMSERLFVLVPLDEIAHDTMVPGSLKSVGSMLSTLQARP